MSSKLIRLDEVLSRNRYGRAKTYARIKAGLYPPPLKLGKSSAWLESEDTIVRSALISGKRDEEILAIVRTLVSARASAYTNSLSEYHALARPSDGDSLPLSNT